MIFNPVRHGSASKSEFTVKINATGTPVYIGGAQYNGEQTVKVDKNTIISINIPSTSSQVENLTFNGEVVASTRYSSNKRSLEYRYPVLQDCEVKTWIKGQFPIETYCQTITTE